MKILKKKEMIVRNQVLHIKTERKIMEMIDHPFIIKLVKIMKDEKRVYFLMEYIKGKDLFEKYFGT